MKNKRKLTAYQKSSDGAVFIRYPDHILKHTGGNPYPHLQCPYGGDCNSNCAFFNCSWKVGSDIFCDKSQIGVLE